MVIKVWRLSDKTNTATLKGHTGPVYALQLTHDSKTLYSGSHDDTIKVWRLSDCTNITTLKGHTLSVHALKLSRDNETLYSGSSDATIKVWRLSDYTNTATLEGHTNTVHALHSSPDNQTLYSGSEDKTVKIWRLKMTPWFEGAHAEFKPTVRALIFELLLAYNLSQCDEGIVIPGLVWDDFRYVICVWIKMQTEV
jgi:WD40 repeat protein